ncbi:MAG: hypothetical protein CVU24_04890 [Betaproteobacteria bacterium HGW-Betaproteobacteria-18]|nr:MAG: hypothetical protein CVU24_04890 [Betaproteobacteria bacterium HGW-Betaproteobacteria-18]
MQDSHVQEPLEESAPLAARWAQQHCEGCGWYHGFWQHMRLMGMGKTLSGVPHLFLQAVAQWQGQQGLRVLVSGAADASALAHVVQGLGGAKAVRKHTAHLTVLDRCETPLSLNRWYAQHAELDVTCHCSDALDFQTDQTFDLILTSSFLGYFKPEQRQQLFAVYARLLKPTGRLVFANRLRSGPQDVAIGFNPAEAQRFMDRARQANAQLPPALQWSVDKLQAAALAYTHSFRSYPVNSLETVAADLGSADMVVKHHQLSEPQLPAFAQKAGLAGPSTAGDSTYLFIEAGLA